MSCRGLCDREQSGVACTLPKYKTGQKWCRICTKYMKTSDIICYCCRRRLRTKSRDRKTEARRN